MLTRGPIVPTSRATVRNWVRPVDVDERFELLGAAIPLESLDVLLTGRRQSDPSVVVPQQRRDMVGHGVDVTRG